MIKAAGRKDGKPIYIIGLSESNVARLEGGAPIAFPGRELHVEGVHVLIAYKPARARALNVAKIYKALGLPRDTTLCALTLDRDAVDLLRASGCIVNTDVGGLPGDVWILYAPSEAELVAHFNDTIGTKLVTETPLPGECYELDPATGAMVRTRGDA